MTSDQDYNTAHGQSFFETEIFKHIYFDLDRSSETDDDVVQEYDARPLSKSKSKLDQISQSIIGKHALKQKF